MRQEGIFAREVRDADHPADSIGTKDTRIFGCWKIEIWRVPQSNISALKARRTEHQQRADHEVRVAWMDSVNS